MKIRSHHLKRLPLVRTSLLSGEIALLLRSAYPAVLLELPEGATKISDLTDERLEELAILATQRASHFGLTRPHDVKRFAVFMFLVAPNFYVHPRIRAILTDSTIPVASRLDKMKLSSGRLSERDWVEARKSYASGAWNPDWVDPRA